MHTALVRAKRMRLIDRFAVAHVCIRWTGHAMQEARRSGYENSSAVVMCEGRSDETQVQDAHQAQVLWDA